MTTYVSAIALALAAASASPTAQKKASPTKSALTAGKGIKLTLSKSVKPLPTTSIIVQQAKSSGVAKSGDSAQNTIELDANRLGRPDAWVQTHCATVVTDESPGFRYVSFANNLVAACRQQNAKVGLSVRLRVESGKAYAFRCGGHTGRWKITHGSGVTTTPDNVNISHDFVAKSDGIELIHFDPLSFYAGAYENVVTSCRVVKIG